MENERYIIEFDDKAPDYRMVILRMKGYLTHRCGYVSVPKGHPFHGKDYDHEIPCDYAEVKINPTDPIGTLLAAANADKDNPTLEIAYAADIHGGITYAGSGNNYPIEGDDWWFGFDAAHVGDDYDGGQSLEYMQLHCEKLKAFLQGHATTNEGEQK